MLRNLRAYLLKKTFSIWQALGFHIYPNHFYSPIPDKRTLKDNQWNLPSELIGVNMNEEKQLALMALFVTRFKTEYDRFPKHRTSKPEKYFVSNPAFGSVDGEILFCMIRRFKPRRIFEVGSGYSSFLIAQAIMQNKLEEKNYQCDYVVIDPYPNPIIKKGFPGLTKLIVANVQNVPLTEFLKLDSNDILFIDSSHILKIGSDVQYKYLEILPRLNRGVIIHIHDIFFPLDYYKDWIIKEHIFWNEQYLLQSFLSFNYSFEVLWAGKYMSFKYSTKLKKAFSSNAKGEQWPASFWMRRIK
jgi:hypothetical protein